MQLFYNNQIFIKCISKCLIGLILVSSLGACGQTQLAELPVQNTNPQSMQASKYVSEKNEILINKITTIIEQKKLSGHIAALPASLYESNVMTNDGEVVSDLTAGEKLDEFYDNPRETLTTISNEDQGTEKLELLDSLYSEQNAATVADKLGNINPDMKDMYEDNLQNMFATDESRDMGIAQGIINADTGKIDLSQIKCKVFTDSSEDFSQAALTWSSMHMYYGLAASALAGQLVFEYTKWYQWFRYVALGVSIASYVGMNHMLNQWNVTRDLIQVITKRKGSVTMTTTEAKQVLTLGTTTIIPIGFLMVARKTKKVLKGYLSWYTTNIVPIMKRVSVSSSNISGNVVINF